MGGLRSTTTEKGLYCIGQPRAWASSQGRVTKPLGRVRAAAEEILCRRQDQYAPEPPPKVFAKVLLIAGQKVRGSAMDCRLQDGRVFLRERHARWQWRNTRHNRHSFQGPCQPLPLVGFGQVDPGFFN